MSMPQDAAAERSLAGRVALVTGGTSGVGLETARGLLLGGAAVTVVGRDPARGQRAVADLQASAPGGAVTLILADLSEMAGVRSAAAAFLARNGRLDILVNNAGGVFIDRSETSEGTERTWATNFASMFLLTNLLLGALRQSPQGRIVNVASAVMSPWLTLADLDRDKRYWGYRAYPESKLAVTAFTKALARRLAGTAITANAVHPGLVWTPLLRGGLPRWLPGFGADLVRRFSISPQEGARTPLHVATAPELAAVTGAYFVECRQARPRRRAEDAATQERVWALGERLTGQPFLVSPSGPPPAAANGG